MKGVNWQTSYVGATEGFYDTHWGIHIKYYIIFIVFIIHMHLCVLAHMNVYLLS